MLVLFCGRGTFSFQRFISVVGYVLKQTPIHVLDVHIACIAYCWQYKCSSVIIIT